MRNEGLKLRTVAQLLGFRDAATSRDLDVQTATGEVSKKLDQQQRQMSIVIIEGLRAVYDLSENGKDVQQQTRDELATQLVELTATFQKNGWVEFAGRVFFDVRRDVFRNIYQQAVQKAHQLGKELPTLRSEYYIQNSDASPLYGWGVSDGYSGPIHGINYNTMGYFTWGFVGKKYFGVFHNEMAQLVKKRVFLGQYEEHGYH